MKKNLKSLLLLPMLLFAVSAFAGAGFHESEAVKVKFNVSGSDSEKSLNLNNQSSQSLGTVTSLSLKSFLGTTWKDGSGNVCNVKMYYVVYPDGQPSSSFSNKTARHKKEWDEGGAKHQQWEWTGDVNLLSGLGNGDYVLECYFPAEGNQSSSSGCNSEAFTANNGGGNYKFTFTKSGSSTCDPQPKGASIPAGTIIFFDNSNGIFADEVWLSVPTNDTNGNASSVDQGSYVRKNDKWYKMVDIGDNIYQATITTASSYGRMSFWDKNGSTSDDVYQNTVVFQAPYTVGKNKYKGDNTKDCYNDNRQTHVYFQGEWSEQQGLYLSLSASEREVSSTDPITLSAIAIGVSGTNYTFEYKLIEDTNWTTLATQSSSTYTLSGSTLPSRSTYYRVKYGTETSSESLLTVTNCTVQEKGSEIPALTTIFYDNSNGIFADEVWLSVPTNDTNGNASSVDQGSYVRKNDKWYKMEKVGKSLWKATITTASKYGRMSFWDKNGSTSDDVYQNTVVFQAPYKPSYNIYQGNEEFDCYNSGRATSVYFQGEWSTLSGVVLSISPDSRNEDDTDPITLSATKIGIEGSGNYTFEYRQFDSDTWTTLATQESPEYILKGSELPSKSSYYRVSYSGYTSEAVKLSVFINCTDGGTAKNILKYTFGTLPELKGDNSRTSSSDMAKGYKYQPYPYKINDGYYAVVATPYYCGCGDGSSMKQKVTECEGNNMWFRDIKDHTLGDKGTAGSFGAMLMINFTHEKSEIAYEHILTADEKKLFVKGSTLSFSAYFASAAKKEATDVNINMKLMIQYKAQGSLIWETKASLINKVKYEDGWVEGKTSIDIDDTDGDYRVVISNNGKAGTGNDALIDDISLDLCVPTFPLDFYNSEKDSSYTECTYLKMDEKQIIRIPKKDYGHGDKNCVLLLSVDPSKEVGKAGRYKVLDEMRDTTFKESNFYYLSRSANELLRGTTGSGKLQAFVTDPDSCTIQTRQKIEDGTINPLEGGDYQFSTNLISFNISCNDDISCLFEGNVDVCEESGKKENDLPTFKFNFGSISKYAYYTISEDGNAVASDVELSAQELTDGEAKIDLNNLTIDRTVGTHKFKVYMYEKAKEDTTAILCEKTSSQIDLIVHAKPVITADLPSTIDKCKGVTKNISITATNTTTYSWQVKKSEGEEWSAAEGAENSATYIIPANAESDWQYRVLLSNEYCTIVESNVLKLTVVECDKVILTMVADKTELCNGDEVTFTATVVNKSDISANIIVKNVGPSDANLLFESATPSVGSYDATKNEWSLTLQNKDDQATIKLLYKSNSNTLVNVVEKLFVSKLGSKTWSSFDEQTDEELKSSYQIKLKGVSKTPELSPSSYNECAETGDKMLADFVSSDKSELHWYSDEALTSEIIPAKFDKSDVNIKNKKYYVTNTESGSCVSEKSTLSVTVKKYAVKADITANGSTLCKGDNVTASASTTTVQPSPKFIWYSDAELTQKLYEGATYQFSALDNITLYVSVQNENICENKPNDGKDVVYTVKTPVNSVSLHEKGLAYKEYDYDGAPTISIGIGETTTKEYKITPENLPAETYSIKWFVNDNQFDGSFPQTPYNDKVYKIVVTDGCGHKHEAVAGTQVAWPTIFMPYDNCLNMDFVKGVYGGIELYVYDRTGNMVSHSNDGWDGYTNGKIAMPGVYYYRAILPDGSVKKGNVEIYKK